MVRNRRFTPSMLLFAAACTANASQTTTFRTLTITPPPGCSVCVTSFNLNATASAFFDSACDDTSYSPDVDADIVLGDGSCQNGLLNEVRATSNAATASQECNVSVESVVRPETIAGGGLRFVMSVTSELNKECLGCDPVLQSLVGAAGVEVAFEFRTVPGGQPCSGGTVLLTGGVEIPPTPSVGDGRTVVFVPGLDGCLPPSWNQRSLAGDCGSGIDSLGFVSQTATCTAGLISTDTKELAFTDAQFDLNGDGRFSERDWPLIQALLGSTDPADLDRFNVCPEDDLNGNGDPTDDQIIAQEDLDLIRAALDAGLGAGDLGDMNGDNLVDCADYALLPSSLSATICDPAYRVTLDADLDGDNDASDLAAVLALFPTADLAAPFGVLDLNDITAFNAAFTANDPLADFAPSFGVFDLNDLNAFLSAFNTPCP